MRGNKDFQKGEQAGSREGGVPQKEGLGGGLGSPYELWHFFESELD